MILFFASFSLACCVTYAACNIAFRLTDRVKSLEIKIERLGSILDSTQRDLLCSTTKNSMCTKSCKNKDANKKKHLPL